MSTISAGTTSGTALVTSGDTTGQLVFQTNGTTTAMTISTGQVVTVNGTTTVGAQIRLLEGSTNGTNYVGVKAPNSLAADTTFTLPSADGTNGQYLRTDGAGNLSFATVPTTSPAGSTGQIQINNAGAFGAVSSGTSGQFLISQGAGASPTWLTTVPIANGGTNSSATPTAGAIAYGTGSAFAFTSAGTSGQVLTSNGAGAPTWSTVSSGGMTFVTTITPTSGNSYTVSGLGSSYKQLVVILNNLTFGGNISGGYIQIEFSSDNGSSFTSPVQTTYSSTTSPWNAAIDIYNFNRSGTAKAIVSAGGTSPNNGLTGGSSSGGFTAVCNAIRISCSSGGFLGAGTIQVYGIA